VVFDLAELDPGPLRRVTDFPAGTDRLTADAPRGLRHVLVNGAPIRVDGDDTRDAVATLPGALLTRGSR
jgi:N-acyl-D-amino-acid deacylase